MQNPVMRPNGSRSVGIPALMGGVNLSDSLNLVDDNQLTDMSNLWYKDGILTTRPAVSDAEKITEISGIVHDDSPEQSAEIYSVNVPQYINGDKYLFIVKKTVESLNDTGQINLTVLSGKEVWFTANASLSKTVKPDSEMFFTAKPVKKNGCGIFMLVSYKNQTSFKKSVKLYEVIKNEQSSEPSYVIEALNTDEYYSPTVLINGKGKSYSTLPAEDVENIAVSSFLEGYSLFYDAYNNFCFTTDGVSSEFVIPRELLMTTCRVEYTDRSGKIYKTDDFDIKSDAKRPLNDTEYSVLISTKTNTVKVVKTADVNNNGVALESGLNGNENNFVVKIKENYSVDAGAPNAQEQKNALNKRPDSLLYGMSFSAWFGGTAGGIFGGGRLFAAGNNDDNKNVLVWSDVSNPTYFSENNYVYVGSNTQAITALAKQDNMLVIFKENEMFYTYYGNTVDISASEVMLGSVVDIAANTAYFPMIQIHAEIGCDIPNSIQLCGDRLVWACKDRHIYMLRSANQYSTCNVMPISDMCDNALKKLSNSQIHSAISCIFEGHYILAFGNKAFVLNYDYYYFKNLPSYADSKQSQRKLIWYIWDLPNNDNDAEKIFKDFISSGDECTIVEAYGYFDDELNYCADFWRFKMLENADKDSIAVGAVPVIIETPIISMLQSKMFDFDLPNRYKRIEQLYIGFGETAGMTTLSYITDNGVFDGGRFELVGNSDNYSPTFIKTKRFLPSIRRALRFGFKLKCIGRIAIDHIIINYKTTGVTR